MPRIRHFALMALIGSTAFAQLQTRPPVLQLSMKQAVDIALAPEGNTRVKLAEEAIKQAEARANQSRAALLPNLDGTISDQSETNNLKAFGFQFQTLPIPGFSIPSFVGPFELFDARVSATQTVLDFSAIRTYQASKIAIQAVKADNEGTRDQVTDQVARAYLSGLRAQASYETAKANVELSLALRKLAQSQKDAGTGTGIEITRADVQLANDRQRLLVAENEVERSHLELLKILGLKLATPVELTDKLQYIAMDNVDEAQAVADARANRAELKAQQRREDTARLSYSSAKMARMPSLSAFGNYGSLGSSINSSVPTRSIGLSARIPIFDGGRRDARRAETASQYRQEKIRTVDLGDQVELDVRLAIDSLQSAAAQVKAAEEGLTLAETEVAQAQRRYKAGVSNSIEVTDAQTRLQRARDNRIAALFNHNLARIDLGTATGTIQSMIH